MNHLSFLTGAGVNIAVANECPDARGLAEFTYQKISKRVYEIVSPELQAMFSPDSFDYILGGLMTINLVIEKAKTDLERFAIDPQAFGKVFRQNTLQESIVEALLQIEDRLTVQVNELVDVATHFNPTLEKIQEKFAKVHYFTVNFDGLFDHIIYGPGFPRKNSVTDFWLPSGFTETYENRRFCIYHLHGDLRYKPFKKTYNNNPPYKWPVLVVGDGDFKRGVIGGHQALAAYHEKMGQVFRNRTPGVEHNVLAIMGFGFRPEDSHVIGRVQDAAKAGVFDKIYVYDVDNKQVPADVPHEFVDARQTGLRDFIDLLQSTAP